MKITLSIVKADITSISGHVCPAPQLLSTVRTSHIASSVHVDDFASGTGGDIAVPMTHKHGLGHKAVHQADLRRLLAGTEVAKEQGLRGAGQNLLKDAFSGIVRGMGPTVAEMEFNEWLATCTTVSSRSRQMPCASILEPGARHHLGQSHQYAPARLLRRCHAPHGGAGIYRNHGESHGPGTSLPPAHRCVTGQKRRVHICSRTTVTRSATMTPRVALYATR